MTQAKKKKFPGLQNCLKVICLHSHSFWKHLSGRLVYGRGFGRWLQYRKLTQDHKFGSLQYVMPWGRRASSLSLGSSQLVNTPAQHTGGEQHSWQAHSISISISASADKSERQTRESWTRDSETWRGNSADREITWRLLDLQIDSCSKISFLIVILLDRKLRGGGQIYN